MVIFSTGKLSSQQETLLHQVYGKCYTYHSMYHCLCDEWHLVLKCVAQNWWCRAHTYTLICFVISRRLCILVNDPLLNRNIAYQLSQIWNEVLFNTQDLQLKWILLHHQKPTVPGTYYKLKMGCRWAHTFYQHFIPFGRYRALHP